MDFNAFDTQKIREYAERAKKEWGETTEYQEFEAKNARLLAFLDVEKANKKWDAEHQKEAQA